MIDQEEDKDSVLKGLTEEDIKNRKEELLQKIEEREQKLLQ